MGEQIIPILFEWLGGAVAFVLMLVLTPAVIWLARRRQWVAAPSADRWHERPTALMGGLAIFAAVTLASLFFVQDNAYWAIWLGAAIMFVTGWADDRHSVRPATKLTMQILATLCLVYGGYAVGQQSFAQQWPMWLSLPLTFFWVIGITNAVNLLDNMDGLAAGIAAIAALTLAIFATFTGAAAAVGPLAAITGAALGFLVFNFKPARIFMGDCGSLFLGYMIAAFSLVIQGQIASSSGLAVYLVAIAVLAVPIFDTTLVTFMRSLNGRSVSQGGRDHSSHRLVFLGLSERRAVLTLYVISISFGALALTFHFADVELFLALATFMVVGLAVFGSHLGSANVYEKEHATNGAVKVTRMPKALAVVRALLGTNWKVIAGLAADLMLIMAAFIFAHYLRFENGLMPTRAQFLIDALPAIVGIKIAVFYAVGLYRGIWRHAGTPEIIKIGKASLIASILGYIALATVYGPEFLSEAVFFIDWMILTLAIAGSRLSFRGMRQYLSTKRTDGRRVILYGAGYAGILTLRELRQNTALGLQPIGFVDDDPDKSRMTVQGLSVLGGIDALQVLCRNFAVEEVLITTLSMTSERKREVHALCEEMEVECKVFNLSFSPVNGEMELEEMPGPVEA